MLRSVTWRLFAGMFALLASDVIAGIWLEHNAGVVVWTYRLGLTAATFAPVILLAAYTVSGNKWWQNDLGSALAVFAFGVAWMSWPLAWAFWFQNGMLTLSWLAWFEVSGPLVVAVSLLWLTAIFIRIRLYRKNGAGNE